MKPWSGVTSLMTFLSLCACVLLLQEQVSRHNADILHLEQHNMEVPKNSDYFYFTDEELLVRWQKGMDRYAIGRELDRRHVQANWRTNGIIPEGHVEFLLSNTKFGLYYWRDTNPGTQIYWRVKE